VGIASAACLAAGQLRVGGALFLLRFFLDCLDGQLARAQGSSSHRGAAYDIICDVVCVTSVYAGLAWWATRTGRIDEAWALGLLVAITAYQWALAHRKALAPLAEMGDGGAHLGRQLGFPVARQWTDACRRINMSPIPWTVEAETLVLGLLPLLGGAAVAAYGVLLAFAFYVVASVVNLRRIWRIAGALDQQPRVPATAQEAVEVAA